MESKVISDTKLIYLVVSKAYVKVCLLIRVFSFLSVISGLALCFCMDAKANTKSAPYDFSETIKILSSFGNRATGSKGCKATAEYIKKCFSKNKSALTGSHIFKLPVRKHFKSQLIDPDQNISIPISPVFYNAISLNNIAPGGISAPLVYVGSGETEKFDGKDIKGAIILMDLDSGKRWQTAAALGAKALIFIDKDKSHFTNRFLIEEKKELSPVYFPMFYTKLETIKGLFGDVTDIKRPASGKVASNINILSKNSWKNTLTRNIYSFVPGKDPELSKELILIEAFFDSTMHIAGISPGADEACSIACLLEIAKTLQQKPPLRSVLLVATSGHAQTLTGMREMISSISTKSKYLKKLKKRFTKYAKNSENNLRVLKYYSEYGLEDASKSKKLQTALQECIKNKIDKIAQKLVYLRTQSKGNGKADLIDKLTKKRRLLNRFCFNEKYSDCSNKEKAVVNDLIAEAINQQTRIYDDMKSSLKMLASAKKFRKIVKGKKLKIVISLHLSSHGSGIGAFSRGFGYLLKPNVNRKAVYSEINDLLLKGAEKYNKKQKAPSFFYDTLRCNRIRPWESYFIDRPFLGGEVSALAGYTGFSFVTVNDARSLWGTCCDLYDNVNLNNAKKQSSLICFLFKEVADAPDISTKKKHKNGFATVQGRGKILRYGELFPDQSASDAVIVSFQGKTCFYSMVDSSGLFFVKGVADKKQVFDKLIIEGYRFDPLTGSIVMAIDKRQTGKSSYRLKIRRRYMETDIVMFSCRYTTLLGLLEPRTFNYMTKIRVIDGRSDTLPRQYWYSRIDTRSSVITSVFLEPEARMKIILSDNILRKKMILSNAKDFKPEGIGYKIDSQPFIHFAGLTAAKDMWALLEPRISHLEKHGIKDENIKTLFHEGKNALKDATDALIAKKHTTFFGETGKSWALASRVYNHIEKTQKDVLTGVLFYIAMFVPFAFFMECFLFSYTNIHKKIIAFSGILIILVTIVYNIHPAFKLAYSPFVIILAFFIILLSSIVTIIIFSRFEDEMLRIQKRAVLVWSDEASPIKTFAAAFFIGANNLKRRPLRTCLTCITLIILTFTIMSFTSVKTMQSNMRLLFGKDAPYHGVLLKQINWKSLPRQSLTKLEDTFGSNCIIAPRAWLGTCEKTGNSIIPVKCNEKVFEAKGALGLSSRENLFLSGDKIISCGRWFNDNERQSVLLSELMAKYLGIDIAGGKNIFVELWGISFEVVGIFSGKKLMQNTDLDAEPLTPAIFSSETFSKITEEEMAAIESGEDIQRFQSRYRHIKGALTIILPYQTLMTIGGHLKSVSACFKDNKSLKLKAEKLANRFGLLIFCGEKEGIFVYSVSELIKYSGMPNIIIPLMISLLIVFNTMTGNVFERKGEIATYTSVGLSPLNVSFVFIAEALAMAVISITLGYLAAQTGAGLFANTSFFSSITVNYSSLAGIMAMVLVMAVVLISVIYPSKVAARIAGFNKEKMWIKKDDDKDCIEVTLPFLIKNDELNSLSKYMYNYFKAHQDISHGVFSTGETNLISKEKNMDNINKKKCALAYLTSKVWLAPFDLGIMQLVDMLFYEFEEASDFFEIKMLIKRKSGEVNAWKRIVHMFIINIRKQLLIWRLKNKTSV